MKIVGTAEQAGDAMPLDEGHQRARVEPAEHHVAAADHGQEVRRAPAVDVEQRDDVEDDVVLGEAEADLRREACRYSSRWVIATPLGRPVVPLV